MFVHNIKKRYVKMNLNQLATELFNNQIKYWELAQTNYKALASVRTKSIPFNGFDIDIQFNPARIQSSGAKLDKKTLAERPCFLCGKNLPAEQERMDAGDYYILVNPFPILPEHFTIPRKEHTPQQIKPYFRDMLEFAKQLDNYVVFYNGPKAGASAPDHMHFQAGTKNFLPLINDYDKLKAEREILLQQKNGASIYTLKDYLRTVVCIEANDTADAQTAFEKLYTKWQGTSSEEPVMNIVCNYKDCKWYVFLFPRKNFRPWQYYAKTPEEQLLISMGTVEMCGVLITPIEEHFERINRKDIVDIYNQSSLEIHKQALLTYEPSIDVGIMYRPKIKFRLNGQYVFIDGNIYSGEQEVYYTNGKIIFKDDVFETLTFRPLKQENSFDLLDVTIGIDFHWERQENHRFKGTLKFIIENEQITAVNQVKLEDYLTSVISSEMSATASEQLLKAHAVISRSWLLANLDPENQEITPSLKSNKDEFIKWYERDAHSHFDVCADDHCQRYQGITRASTRAVEKAISETRGEVLWYEDEICDARFSKSCGGISETFENAWAEIHHPYLEAIIDNQEQPDGYDTDLTVEENAQKWIRNAPAAFCNTTDKEILSQVLNDYDQETTDFYRWKVIYSQDELSALIARKSGIDFGVIIDLVPIERGKSGRIIKLKITGTKKSLIVGKELEIRKWLSASHLYSSAFVIDKENIINDIPQQFILTGAGWGHGVGLCQIGAAVMGAKGYNYKAILKHYFSGVELRKLY